jgi:hypothetical protein
MTPILAIAAFALLVVVVILWQRYVALRRTAYIRTFDLPPGLFERLRKRRPSLSLKDCQLVARGLRQFFLAYLAGGRRYVSMPSQVVDDLWHEFILYTRHYEQFCGRAFGRFLHHTPAVAVGTPGQGDEGLRRCWKYACLEENINPRRASRLPLLFALDGKLGIDDGFRYVADCGPLRRASAKDANGATVYCGSGLGTSCGGGGESGGRGGDADGLGGGGDSGGGGASGDAGCGGGGCGGGGCSS